MYHILLGNDVFYDVRDKTLLVENPELSLELNKVGTLTFKVYPSHPYFNSLQNRVSIFSVEKDNNTIFKGRMINEEQGIYNSKKVTVESALAYLNDSVVRPYSFSGTPAEEFTNLINEHNSQVTAAQQLKVGIITVTDPNDYIARSAEGYASTWDVLNDDLISRLGGYLRLRYESDGTYIDYLSDFDDTSTQVIELGSNLIDVLVKNDAANVYTVVIPLGAEIEAVVDEETGETITPAQKLTIESVNDGLDYLVNQTAYNQYGWIVAPTTETTWDDVTIAANLKRKGQQYLDNTAVMLKSTIEVNAIDLNVTDAEIEAFFLYEYIRFVSSVHNINARYILNAIKIPLQQPENMTITLGEEVNSLTGIQMGNSNSINNIITKVEGVEADTSGLNNKIDNVKQELQSNITSIEQNQEEILMTALQDYVSTDEFSTYQEQVSTQFSQTAEDFTFSFNNITSQINTLDGETQQQFQEISKYIRFEDGNIILGEAGNELTLRIENDIISFIQNNSQVAYLSNNKLFVTDGEFLNSLIIGNFAWKPRANGNLSLVYIGGDTVG